MIRLILLSIVCVAAAMAATTIAPTQKHTHPTREPSEHHTYRFVYEPHTHNMIVASDHTCYIFTLTDAERQSVHSDSGIAALELKLLTSLSTATLTQATEDQLTKFIRHACGGHITTFYNASA